MNRKFSYLVFLSFLAATYSVFGQQIRHFEATEKKHTPEENMALGNALYRTGEYFAASKLYTLVLEERPEDVAALYQLANAHRQLRDYRDAADLYEKVMAKGDASYPESHYWCGLMLQSMGQYDNAIDQLKKSTPDSNIPASRIEEKIRACEFAKTVKPATSDITMSLLGYNKPAFAAFPSGDGGILFTGVDERITRKKVQYDSQKGIYDTLYANTVFQATASGNIITNPSALNLDIKEKEMSVGGASLSPDQNSIYFSVCKTLEGNNACSLYKSVKEKKGWGSPVMLPQPINMTGYSSKHPMVIQEETETILFFASNRPGGSGGYDLWYAKMGSDNNFGSPTNLGTIINTPGDDVTPFYDANSNSLFFSSDGHPGLGQLDVYLVQLDKTRQNGNLVHLGTPINSSTDDYYFSIFDHGRSGYLSSNRSSPYDKLYAVDFKDPFSYKHLDETMAELKTFDENDVKLPLFRESFAYKPLEGEDQTLSAMTTDDIAISGTLLANGSPGSNKTVMLLDGDGNVIDTTTADENGFFEFKPLPPNQQYSLMFQEKDAPMNVSVEYKNQSGEVLKSVRSEDQPDFFHYKNLSGEGSNITSLTGGDSNLALTGSEFKTLFKPAMTYADYQAVEEKYFDQLQDKINLRIQIGAYRHPSSRLFRNLKLAYPVERVAIGDVTKFLSGNFKKLGPAEVQRKSAFDQGVSDAFIAVYYEGKRIAILLFE
jgi:WD40-like Beta Propeller Repeat/Tetratricopeptide repeat